MHSKAWSLGLLKKDQTAPVAPYPADPYSDRFARCMKKASGTLSAAVAAIR